VITGVNDSTEHQSAESIALDAEKLNRAGVLPSHALELLQAALAARLNVAISGPEGSGKRNLLHSLVPYMACDGQILAVQNPDEPLLERRGVTSLRAHPDAEDDCPRIGRRYLLSLVPRMHPTGLILDRVSGAEAVPLLRLLLSMDGIVFSIAAESPQDVLDTLVNLERVYGERQDSGLAIRILSTALQLVVQLDTARDGSSLVVSLTEVAQAEDGCHVLREIFTGGELEPPDDGEAGSPRTLCATGVRPLFLRRLEELGIPVPDHIFT
jgi:Flp pilus assembly CpaF family ATPase